MRFCLAPLIIAVRADMELLLDLMQFGVHVLDLGTEPAAIVVLNATPELAVQFVRFRADVFVLRPDTPIGAIGPHFVAHMIDHPIQMFDLAVEPADGIRILPRIEHSAIVVAWAAFVSRILIGLLLDAFVVFMRGGRESETGKAENRRCCNADDFFHVSFRCGRFDGKARRRIQILPSGVLDFPQGP